MLRPRSLVDRLASLYAAALVAGLCIFSVLALVTIDHVQRVSVDTGLENESTIAASLVLPDTASGMLDPDNVNAFRHTLGGRANGAYFDARLHLQLTTIADVPDAISNLTSVQHMTLQNISADGVFNRIVATPVVRGNKRLGTIVLWRPIDDVTGIDRRVATGFAITILLLTVAALRVGMALARRALHPMRELAILIADIEAIDLSRRIGRAEDDEIGKLCATFDRMLARLEDAFVRQRRFAGDVAHEIRTPLAVILAEIDVIRRRVRSAAEYEQTLDIIREETTRLNRMVTDLLASYRDNTQPLLTKFFASAVVIDAIAAISPLADARGIAIFFEKKSDGEIVFDRSELVRALVAVLDNAQKYGGENRPITVCLEVTKDDAHITIRDRGPGFTKEGMKRAAERFWRDGETHGREGAGLGLSLVDAIVSRGGGSVRFSNASDGGACVDITLPIIIKTHL